MKIGIYVHPQLKLFVKWFLCFKFLFRGCRINSGLVSHKATLNREVGIGYLTRVSKYAKIGDYSYVGGGGDINNVEIKKYSSIGNNVCIGAADHLYYNTAMSPYIYSFIKIPCNDIYKRTIVGSDVWIGNNSVIKGGVTIGDGAVVGAGAGVQLKK